MSFPIARLVLASSLLLGACASEDVTPPPIDPNTPMTIRTLNTSLNCADFERKPDGSWSPVRDTKVIGPNGPYTVGPTENFRAGEYNQGVDVAYGLNRLCLGQRH